MAYECLLTKSAIEPEPCTQEIKSITRGIGTDLYSIPGMKKRRTGCQARRLIYNSSEGRTGTSIE